MSYVDAWQVALRRRTDRSLPEGNTKTPFVFVKNSLRYWAADPFLIERDGETYLFAELYDRIARHGVLGYCRVSQTGEVSKWRVCIREKYHLSFPHITERNGQIYITAEAGLSDSLYDYQAAAFPDRWEKQAPYLQGERCVDTVWLCDEAGSACLTMFEPENRAELLRWENGECSRTVLSTDPHCARNAGALFRMNGKTIRVFQDCSSSYGAGIGFAVLSASPSISFGDAFFSVSANDIIVQGPAASRCYHGLHTYNQSQHYEVIDLKYTDTGILAFLGDCASWLIHRVLRREETD